MSTGSHPLTLRPLPTGNRQPKSLAEFISRVNSEGGSFRNLSEDDLREQVEALEAEGAEAADIDMEDTQDGDEENIASQPVKVEDIMSARQEVLRNVEFAHQNAMLTLDFLSLLLSKETPVQAGLTLSPYLRDTVGIGTLGADKLATSNLTDEKLQASKLVATGWKFVEVNNTVDSLMSSATRLQKEIKLETKYWGEVLAASENGWSVSSLPHERHTLGVKYGFDEAAAKFSANNFAPMRRSDTGSVSLDTARIGRPRRLAAIVKRSGTVIGRSVPHKLLPEDAPLEARVRQSRDSIFDQELWHELNREGRTLLSYGVRLENDSVSVAVDDREIVITLDPIEHDTTTEGWGSDSADALAETSCAVLRLLLSYAHKQNNQRRSRPTALGGTQARNNSTYFLLRPLLVHFKHEQSVQLAAQFVSDLTAVLQSAGFNSAKYTLTEPPTPLMSANLSSSEALYTALLSPREFLFDLAVTPDVRFMMRGKTTVFPFVTQYLVQLAPPISLGGDENPTESAAQSILQDTFAPAEQYPDLREATYYIRQAVARVVAFEAEKIAQETASAQPEGSGTHTVWERTLNGRSIQTMHPRTHEIQFDVCKPLSVDRWDEMEEVDDHVADQSPDLTPELRIYATWIGDEEAKQAKTCRKWVFSAAEARSVGRYGQNLEHIVQGCISDQLKPAV